MSNLRSVKLSVNQLSELKQAREAIGSQQAVADKMGIQRAALASLEVGGRDPSVDMLQRWATAVGLAAEVEVRIEVTLDTPESATAKWYESIREEIEPWLAALDAEGRKHIASMSPPAVIMMATRIKRRLTAGAKSGNPWEATVCRKLKKQGGPLVEALIREGKKGENGMEPARVAELAGQLRQRVTQATATR